MRKAREKLLACFVAAVMALSMVSATALTAFAEQFAPGTLSAQSGGELVYDTAYGVMHGEYALMMKTVTYEAEYKGNMRTYSATITDLVKANGNGAGTVMVHTNDANEDNAAIPGEWTNLKSATEGQDIVKGFMRVSDKSTGKSGVKNLDGSELIPCAYDSLSLLSDAFVGVSFSGDTVNVTFLGFDGSNIGSTSLTAPETESRRNAYAQVYGDYVSVRVNSGSDHYYATMRKDGSKYVAVPGMLRIFSSTALVSGGGFVYESSDGFLYYHPTSGADVKLESAANIYGCSVEYGLITLTFRVQDEGSYNTSYSYYSTSGTKLELGEGSVSVPMADGFIFYSREQDETYGYTIYRYREYDYSGANLREVDATRVFQLDAKHYGAAVLQGENNYQLGVYNFDGTLYKTLANVGTSYAYIYPIYETDDNGVRVIVGYQASWQTAEGNSVYFDADFNPVSSNPGSVSKAQLALADGTAVNARVTYQYDSEAGTEAYVASVTDASGNAIKLGGCTLGIAADGGTYTYWNSVKHGNADLWWGTDSSGKWGAVSSAGEVLVPFQYESYYDGGSTDTDYAMVKKDGVWSFLKVASSSDQNNPGGGDPAAGDPVKDGPAAWTRFAGEDAYGTMAKIVEAGWPDGSGAVVVATFDGYWDALTASGLAGFLGCPVLMTDTNGLSATTRSEIERLGAKTAFVAGGEAAVSAGVEAELSAMGLSVVRAAGDNAAGTARDAYEKSKAYGEWGKTAIVTTADGYWDALAMSPYSYYAHAPIFLAQQPAAQGMRLDADTLAAIEAGGFARVLVAGGTAAVSSDVESQLPGLAVERLAGETAVETSRAIASFCAANGMSKAKVAVATTDGYWDALTGAALCGKTRTPMVLASPASAAAAAEGFVSSESSTIAVGYIFGGEAAVAPASEAALKEATK